MQFVPFHSKDIHPLSVGGLKAAQHGVQRDVYDVRSNDTNLDTLTEETESDDLSLSESADPAIPHSSTLSGESRWHFSRGKHWSAAIFQNMSTYDIWTIVPNFYNNFTRKSDLSKKNTKKVTVLCCWPPLVGIINASRRFMCEFITNAGRYSRSAEDN